MSFNLLLAILLKSVSPTAQMLSSGFILSAVCTHFAIFGVSFTISYSNKYCIIYVWLINHADISVSLGFALSKKKKSFIKMVKLSK